MTASRTVRSAIDPPCELGELTPREREVLKLRLRDRVQAVVFAYEHGIVLPGEERR